MDDIDQKLDAILGNPDLMQQIMSLASQINIPEIQKPEQQKETVKEEKTIPSLDGNLIKGISNLLNNTGIDKNQQTLLSALKPYIGAEKTRKLEKAMQASKMAQLASTYLNIGNLRQITGE